MNRRVVILTAASCLTGLVLGAVWPPPPIPRNRSATAEWSLPPQTLLARYSAEDSAQVTRAARWSGESGAESGVRGNWRLAGFVNDPTPAALIMPQATPAAAGARRAAPRSAPAAGKGVNPYAQAERAVPGGTMPDGSKLVAIDGDTITTELDGCRLVYQLYRPQPVSASPACAEPAAAAEPRKTE